MSNAERIKRRRNFSLDFLTFDAGDNTPLYRQLEGQIRSVILAGTIAPGEKLPSSRQLAEELGIGRNTVISAYQQLVQEGYLEVVKGAGTCVAPDLPDDLLNINKPVSGQEKRPRAVELSRAAQRLSSNVRYTQKTDDSAIVPFRPHVPASKEFAVDVWAKLTNRRTRQMPRLHCNPADTRGFGELRFAIADYLGNVRGIKCDADQVFITAGLQQALHLLARLLLNPGDLVCMEDPGYRPGADQFEAEGAIISPVPVDEEGIRVDELEKISDRVKMVYVTPSSQFPLGMTMSSARRLQLAEWARRGDVVILEDDYNGEYRYVGRPLPPIYGMTEKNTVLYMGTFSKLLFPALRIGYVVLPPELVEPMAALRWVTDRHSPSLEQAVLADFINEGHFARHIRKMRKIYADRQEALIGAIDKHLSDYLDVPRLDAGLHLAGYLKNGLTETQFMKAVNDSGLVVSAVSSFSFRKPEHSSVLLGYAPFSENEIETAVKHLADHLRKSNE